MSRWMLEIWEIQTIVKLDHLVVVQVQLQRLQRGDLCWDRCDGVVGEVQQVQLGEVTEHKREA